MERLRPLEADILNSLPPVGESEIDGRLDSLLLDLNRKIVVLDDDPTGVQTVHDIPVYTDWSEESLMDGFQDRSGMLFFILTNSRGLTTAETARIHAEIARNLSNVSRRTGTDFILMSRSDSTLRGHYPLETQVLKDELEKNIEKRFDGEIIFPFFKEGGRFTIGNVHYVKEGNLLIPAGQTEFAQDKSFGYKESDLTGWCEEKTGGTYKAGEVTCITLEDLRNLQIDRITEQLSKVRDFGKVVVNAVDYIDAKIFSIAFINTLMRGKEFIFRCAASVVKVLGGVRDIPLLTKDQLISGDNRNGGIVLVGSHVQKTTMQLEALKDCVCPLEFIEFDQHLVLAGNGLEGEVKRVVRKAEDIMRSGKTAVIYTKRRRLDLDIGDKDAQLLISVKISDAVTSIIEKLTVRPGFIIAKGGITSSDVGTKALKVKKALVMGQIRPGIPVWMTGKESKFPGMPFIIFPGNVGGASTLREIVETLSEK